MKGLISFFPNPTASLCLLGCLVVVNESASVDCLFLLFERLSATKRRLISRSISCSWFGLLFVMCAGACFFEDNKDGVRRKAADLEQ